MAQRNELKPSNGDLLDNGGGWLVVLVIVEIACIVYAAAGGVG